MGELIALRWRDVDFTGATIRVRGSYAAGHLTTPKSGKVRAVPMAPDVASALAQLGRRENWVGDDDLVFAGDLGSYLDGSALRRRYKEALSRAGLRPLRFHDLRHTFRDPDDRQGGYPPGAGVDGPRRHSDDDALPPLRAARRGRGPGGRGVPRRGSGWPDISGQVGTSWGNFVDIPGHRDSFSALPGGSPPHPARRPPVAESPRLGAQPSRGLQRRTSRGILASARQCVECMAAKEVAGGLVGA